MQFAAMLYFDNDMNRLVNGYIEKLEKYTNNDYMLQNNMPAHITVAMWNSEYNYLGEIKGLAENTKEVAVSFSSISFFNEGEKHIFLAPVKNGGLSRLHSRIYETVSLPDEGDYIRMYKDDDIWVPHMTIGYQVKKDMLGEALAKCLDINLPIKAKAQKIALAVCCPFREIAVLDFAR